MKVEQILAIVFYGIAIICLLYVLIRQWVRDKGFRTDKKIFDDLQHRLSIANSELEQLKNENDNMQADLIQMCMLIDILEKAIKEEPDNDNVGKMYDSKRTNAKKSSTVSKQSKTQDNKTVSNRKTNKTK